MAMMAIMTDKSTIVEIPRTKHKVSLGFIRDCTIDKVTELLLEREEQEERAESADELMCSAAKHPYLNLKIAVCYVLNDYWKLRLFFPIVWRWWAYVWRLDESQVGEILAAGKKKVSEKLTWYSMNTALLRDTRADLKTVIQNQSLLTPKSEGVQPS